MSTDRRMITSAALAAGLTLVVAFVLLPWADVFLDGSPELDKTGLGLLLAGPDVDLLKPAPMDAPMEEGQILGLDDTGNMTTYRAVEIGTAGYAALWLIPLAGVGGTLCAAWMLSRSEYQRIALWGRRLFAVAALLYYAHFLAAYDSIGMTGTGFWIGLVAAVVLLFAEPGLVRLWSGKVAGAPAYTRPRR